VVCVKGWKMREFSEVSPNIYSKLGWKNFGENLVYPSKIQEFFNLNPKVSKLVVYPFEVSKSGNLNLPSTFFVKLDRKL
jgi:hypothetical protein